MGIPSRNRMASFYLLFFVSGLLSENWLRCEAQRPATAFLPRHTAESVLKRNKRYNTGVFEEMKKDNLERECIEEKCSWEEAREVFENKEKTMEFWVRYIDGDQCESSPCQNGAKCDDGMSSYMCWCPVGFTGKNCEIETARQCDVRNGGCDHFCQSDKVRGVTCDCAAGYSLSQDGRTCESEGKFPCGKVRSSIVSPQSNQRSSHALPPVNGTNDTSHSPPPLNTSAEVSTPADSSTTPSQTNATTLPFDDLAMAAFFPTLPTIVSKDAKDKRIVGGNEVTPGEIPWQVALIYKPTLMGFCGGSILSELWVITAAHCLLEGQVDAIFVRVGEHNVRKKEGTERDHEIAEWKVHPHYNKANSQYNHDIALLRLHKPIVYSDYALPVCLGPKEFTETLLQTGLRSVVSGWGKVRFEGVESPVLQKVEVPYVDRTRCKGSSSDRITRFMFCAGYADELKDSCQGDSGGPHTTRHGDTWFLTGIISWGEECAKENKFGIYTRVSRYYAWISFVTGITKCPTFNGDHDP